jgi:hypothetical protein
VSKPPRRKRHLELVGIDGEPTEGERAAIEDALEHIVAAERAARSPSLWLRAGRSQARRLGMLDYRDRFAADEGWRVSTRFPIGGREYAGRYGRGDTK